MTRKDAGLARLERVLPVGEVERSSGRVYAFSDGSVSVMVEMGAVGGTWQPIGFDVRAYAQGSRRGVPLTARELRGVPFGRIVAMARRWLQEDLEAEREKAGPTVFRDRAGRQRASIQAAAAEKGLKLPSAPRIGRPRIPHEALVAASEFYKERVKDGSKHPTKDLAKHLGLTRSGGKGFALSPSGAAKWLRRMRDEGLVPPTRPGVAGYDIQV